MNFAHTRDWLQQAAFYRGNKTAFIDADRNESLTYAESHRVAGAYVHRLRSLLPKGSTVRGTRVALLAQDPLRTISLFFACQRLGLILVPLNYRLSAHELGDILADADPALLLVDQACLEMAERLVTFPSIVYLDETWEPTRLTQAMSSPIEAQSCAICLMLYTSGTTGIPKGVLISHEMLFWNSISTSFRLNLTEHDSVVNFLPYFHTGAWSVLLLPLIHRCATIVLMARFDAARILEQTARHRCSLLFGVPTTLRMMAEQSEFDSVDLQALRCVLTGGESISVALIQRWHARGLTVRQGYGLTEFGPNVFSLEADAAIRKIGSIGHPNYYCEAAVMNDAGMILQGAAEGELILKGPAVCSGYWKKPEMTQDLFLRGWLRTGDQVRRDEEGYYFVVGRKKDMYISGGENIYPAEVEAALAAHPAVREVAVVGVPDSRWGERGIAFISPIAGRDVPTEEILEHCRQRLARFKMPADIIVLEALPRNGTGKIAKQELKRLAHERYAAIDS